MTVLERLLRALDRDNALAFAVLQHLRKRDLIGPWVGAATSLSDRPRWARRYPDGSTAAAIEKAHGFWSAEIATSRETRTFNTLREAAVWADQHFRNHNLASPFGQLPEGDP